MVGASSSGVINIKKRPSVSGRDILYQEDIIDTGKTLKTFGVFKDRNAASVKIATLLDIYKPEGRLVEIEADYTCFTIPNMNL